MKAVLNYASYSPNTKPYSYMGATEYMVLGPTFGILKFNCFNKDGHSMSLDMEGVGVPRLNCNSEYEVEIKITERPKSVVKEYIIK